MATLIPFDNNRGDTLKSIQTQRTTREWWLQQRSQQMLPLLQSLRSQRKLILKQSLRLGLMLRRSWLLTCRLWTSLVGRLCLLTDLTIPITTRRGATPSSSARATWETAMILSSSTLGTTWRLTMPTRSMPSSSTRCSASLPCPTLISVCCSLPSFHSRHSIAHRLYMMIYISIVHLKFMMTIVLKLVFRSHLTSLFPKTSLSTSPGDVPR